MKIKVQAQHLKPGDIVGSGEKVTDIITNSVHLSSKLVRVSLENDRGIRVAQWGRYTMIGVERAE